MNMNDQTEANTSTKPFWENLSAYGAIGLLIDAFTEDGSDLIDVSNEQTVLAVLRYCQAEIEAMNEEIKTLEATHEDILERFGALAYNTAQGLPLREVVYAKCIAFLSLFPAERDQLVTEVLREVIL
jgi:hypothetical protein